MTSPHEPATAQASGLTAAQPDPREDLAPTGRPSRRKRWVLPVSVGAAVLVLVGAGGGWYATHQDQKYKLVAPASFEGLPLGPHKQFQDAGGPRTMVDAEYDRNGAAVVAVAGSYGGPTMAGGPGATAKTELDMLPGLTMLTAEPAGSHGGSVYCGVETGNAPACSWADDSSNVLVTYAGYQGGPSVTAADLAHVAAETLQLRSLMEVDA